jgi:uncharacterized protein (TIGR03083 family)
MIDESVLIPSLPHIERHNRPLISDLRTFDEAAWTRPSYCPGWTAAHVIGHMTLGAHFYAHVVQAGREGVLSLPFGAKDVPDFRAIRTAQMEKLVALSGEERIERFGEAVEALQKVFAEVPAGDLDKPAWHPRCPTPIRYFPGQRFYELILHEWDIRNDPESSIILEGLDHGIKILKDRLPFFYGQTPDANLEGFIRFETRDPAHTWCIEIKNQKAALCPAEGRDADVVLSASASDMILLACGRADIQTKRDSGALKIDGELVKAETFLNILFNPF